MSRRFIIGLHTGSSHFGVDAALIQTDGIGAGMRIRPSHFVHCPYSKELRDLLVRLASNAAPETRRLATLHRVLAEHQALSVRQLLEQSRVPAREVLAIGSPGLSIWHDTDGRFPSAVFVGMTAVLAERTGITVISDFSSRDIAAGGQGVPLSAMVDALLFHDPGEERVLIHLGSAASVVALPANAGVDWRNVIGFQAAPCTMLLDGLMRLLTNGREQFDTGGKHAVQGRCLEALRERWLQNHFFHKRPPKSLPRWEFGDDFLNRAIEQAKRADGGLHDVLCTMTHFVAHAIVHTVQRYLPATPARIILSGRGVRNGFLWHLLEQLLTPAPLETSEVHGVAGETRQAIAAGGLAALTLDGVCVNLPGATGATGARLLGAMTPGDSRNWLRCLSWMARQALPVHSAAA